MMKSKLTLRLCRPLSVSARASPQTGHLYQEQPSLFSLLPCHPIFCEFRPLLSLSWNCALFISHCLVCTHASSPRASFVLLQSVLCAAARGGSQSYRVPDQNPSMSHHCPGNAPYLFAWHQRPCLTCALVASDHLTCLPNDHGAISYCQPWLEVIPAPQCLSAYL